MSLLTLGAALWLGVLTAIGPCTLAGNVAAISVLTRGVGRPAAVLLGGVLYTLGRTAGYLAVSGLLVAGLLAAGEAARFLQRYVALALGPVLILAGMMLLGLLGSTLSLNLAGTTARQRLPAAGPLGALAMGFLLALSFCPVSAGLFFGALIPLAARHGSPVLMPSLFGIGTALPVVAFAFLVAFAGQLVGAAFDRLTKVERVLRTATGVILIAAGIFLTLTHIYGLPLLG